MEKLFQAVSLVGVISGGLLRAKGNIFVSQSKA
jgi:hypothetical protein